MDTKRLLLVGGMLVAAGVVFMQVKKMGTPPPPVEKIVEVAAPTAVVDVDYADVLVASMDIQFGERLRAGSFEWQKWPEDAVSGDFIVRDVDPEAAVELSGQVANAVIYSGEPINRRKMVDTGEQSLMAALISPGMRAVSQRINVSNSAGGFIQPGDRVDIVHTTEVRQPNYGNRAASNTNKREYVAGALLENVRVLAIDSNFGSVEGGAANMPGSTATLELSPDDAEILLAAQSMGDITLVLRGISNRRGTVKSSASKKKSTDSAQSLMVYRGGDQQQVAVRGQ